MMRVLLNLVISSLSLVLMVLILLSCTVQVLMLVTQSWPSGLTVNFGLSSPRMVGTGLITASSATSGLTGSSGLRMPTSTSPTCRSAPRLALCSTRLQLRNSSLRLRVSPTVTTTSCSAGLIPLLTTGLLCFQVVSCPFCSLSSRTSFPTP